MATTNCCGEMVEQVGDAMITWVARKELGSAELTVGITRMKPGGANPAHRHPNCEEVLHILEGDVEHYVEGQPLLRLKAGQTAIIPRNLRHRARNVGNLESRWVVSFSSAERQTIFVKDELDAHLQHLCALFDVSRVDKITWGHAVNSQAAVAEGIRVGTQFFEADILTRASDGAAIMAHPPDTDSDITFDEWIETRRGIKLDMKHASVLKPILAKLTQMVNEKRLPPELPVWLNADLIQITGPPLLTVDNLIPAAIEFQKIHSNTALSPGYTIGVAHGEYSAIKREEMEAATASFGGHVTIPINAVVLCRPGQWAAVRPFLDRPNYSLTLYGKVSKLEMDFLEKNVIGSKVFPDLQLAH